MSDVRIPFTWMPDGTGPNAGGSDGAAWAAGLDAHELPITLELDDTPSNRAALRRLGGDRSVANNSSPERPGIDTKANEEQLASVMRSEAEGGGAVWETAVGFNLVNRLRRKRLKNVSAAWAAYSHAKAASAQIEALAATILCGDVADPTAGATHFYTPLRMPKVKDGVPSPDIDTGGGQEVVDGVDGATYKPGFAHSAAFQQVRVPGIDDAHFKFYRPVDTDPGSRAPLLGHDRPAKHRS